MRPDEDEAGVTPGRDAAGTGVRRRQPNRRLPQPVLALGAQEHVGRHRHRALAIGDALREAQPRPSQRQRLPRPASRCTGFAAALAAVAALVAGQACQHADAPPPVTPRGPTACERASDSMVGAMLARLPASDEPTEQADALRNLIRERCEQDHWSADATRCLTAMQKLDDAVPCAKLMTEDQQAALVRDEEARLGPAPGAQPGGVRADGAAPGGRPDGARPDGAAPAPEKPQENSGPGAAGGAGSGASPPPG